jgi:hypothetical protein
MITVQMAYKDIIDLPESDPALPHLHLRSLTAVD